MAADHTSYDIGTGGFQMGYSCEYPARIFSIFFISAMMQAMKGSREMTVFTTGKFHQQQASQGPDQQSSRLFMAYPGTRGTHRFL